MRATPKATAYRRNRRFGDVHGGRLRPKLADNVFATLHPLKRPAPTAATPILIEENPSRDLYFPLQGAELLTAIDALPRQAKAGLTHLWLRQASKRAVYDHALPLAQFICGSGVRVIVLYPWRVDNKLCFGSRAPKGEVRRTYERFDTESPGRGPPCT